MDAQATPSTKDKQSLSSATGYSKKYIILLIIILGLTSVMDNYATNAPGMLQSSIIREFFVKTGWMDQTKALQLISLLSIAVLFVSLGANIFKSLQDRVGRKPILMISMIGMALAPLLMILSKSYWPYFAGSMVLAFFVTTDMQVMYINEEAPANKRSQFLSYSSLLALGGLLLVPLIRNFTVVQGNENWRAVLIPPVIIGVIVVTISIFFLKETRAYTILKQERAARKVETGKAEKAPSLFAAFKQLRTIPSWNQVKWLLLTGLFSVPFVLINQAYSEIFMDQTGVSLADRNIVLAIATIGMGVAYVGSGFMADRIGRKKAIIINAIVVVALLVMEYFAMWAAPTSSVKWLLLVVAGMSQGIRIGAYWNGNVLRQLMLVETTPTHLRGNAQSINGVMTVIFIIPCTIINSILVGMFPGNVMMVVLIWGIPISLVTLLFTILKIKETLRNDILAIEG